MISNILLDLTLLFLLKSNISQNVSQYINNQPEALSVDDVIDQLVEFILVEETFASIDTFIEIKEMQDEGMISQHMR
jgi:hypothetical protein